MSLIGYSRVSTIDQSLSVQNEQLIAAGVERIFSEQVSAVSTKDRHQLAACLDFVRDGRDEEPVSCELSDLLRELAQSSLRTGCEWELDVPVECLCIVRPLALRRALSNLMRNAEVHGRAPWRLSLECDPSGPCIRVRDHGAGLPGEVLARAGQPFLRADSSLAGAGGTGLGLSLVQRVAGAHGHRAGARSPAHASAARSVSTVLRNWAGTKGLARKWCS